jgi:hypothetical protein
MSVPFLIAVGVVAALLVAAIVSASNKSQVRRAKRASGDGHVYASDGGGGRRADKDSDSDSGDSSGDGGGDGGGGGD